MRTKYVIEISRAGNHNGPGFRTLVLFKGCPLRCKWCSTPDSWDVKPEMGIFHDRCVCCKKCVMTCPNGAIADVGGRLEIIHGKCTACGKCLEACHRNAMRRYGTAMTVNELYAEIEKDKILFKHSGGGVTLSGGEPLMVNPEFNRALVKKCQDNGISVGFQTCGCVPWKNIEMVLPYTDYFLWDMKHMDSAIHKEYTGVGNELILENARKISSAGVPLYLRLPIIPGYTDSDEHVRAVCEFARELESVASVDILPIHHIGSNRYKNLGKEYPLDEEVKVTEERSQELVDIVESYGFNCRLGG